MANRYVYTGGSNTSPYNSWATAATTLTAGLTGAAATDVIYMAHDHAESTAAAITMTSPSTNLHVQVLCVNRAGSVPPVSADLRTTATVTTTGTSNIILSQWLYIYGVSFIAGSGASTLANITLGGTNSYTILVNCKLRLASTATACRIQTSGNVTCINVWENVTVQFGATAQQMDMRGIFTWRKTPSAIAAGSNPSTLLLATAGSTYFIEGVDLSSITGTVFGAPSSVPVLVTMKDCKSLGSAPAISNAYSGTIDVVNSTTADNNTYNARYRFNGAETTETTIVRTGGASDGVTPVSRKIVTTVAPNWRLPFEASPLAVWNETTGSAITLTVECISSAVLNTDDIWMDVEYLGTSNSPLGVFETTTKTDTLATGVANTNSTQTWGGALTGKFKLAKTITPQKKGWVYVYPKVGKASTTVYIDPEITVT